VVDDNSQTPLAAPPHAYVTPRVSPDGRSVLLGVADTSEHVFSYSLAAGTLTQLTFDSANRAPIWFPDGQRMLFASNRAGALNLFAAPAIEGGTPERLTASDSLQMPGSWSPDGELLAFVEHHPSTGRDIWLWRRASGERSVFANSEADESAPRFSPDGRWLAYVSNDTGQAEVYVRSTTSPAARRVSTSGGSEPVWRRDGAALYFRSYGQLMAAPITGGVPGPTRVVTSVMAEPGTFDAAGYDTLGSDRFLMIASAADAATSELRVVLNWRPAAPSSP
jgi:Tol biopolymer transport system component